MIEYAVHSMQEVITILRDYAKRNPQFQYLTVERRTFTTRLIDRHCYACVYNLVPIIMDSNQLPFDPCFSGSWGLRSIEDDDQTIFYLSANHYFSDITIYLFSKKKYDGIG